ncbi:IS630 family transposase [Streptomyces sp. CAS3]
MVPGPKPLSLELSDHERRVLRGWLRKQTASQVLVLRSRIVLACAQGRPNAQVAQDLGASRETVRKWRARFAADRLEGLADRPRSGRRGRSRTSRSKPWSQRRWTRRRRVIRTGRRVSMAEAAGMSQSAVSRIWRAFGLKPHIVETWKLSTDPQFVTKVRDVVGIYLSPPVNALVLAVDEKSQIQALDRTQPVLPMAPTTPAKTTHDYVRHGTTNLFAALDIASGSVIAQHYRRHRHQEFLRFLKVIDATVPKDLELHLALDNYATHKTEPVKKWLLRHPRFHPHFTPTSAS